MSHAYVSKLRSKALVLMREAMQAWEDGTTGDRSTKAKSEFFEVLFGSVAQTVPAAVGTAASAPAERLLAAV